MPRYTITQQYATPRALTPEEQQTLAAVVEAAALSYLRRATESSWQRWTRQATTRARVWLRRPGDAFGLPVVVDPCIPPDALRLTAGNQSTQVVTIGTEPPPA